MGENERRKVTYLSCGAIVEKTFFKEWPKVMNTNGFYTNSNVSERTARSNTMTQVKETGLLFHTL